MNTIKFAAAAALVGLSTVAMSAEMGSTDARQERMDAAYSSYQNGTTAKAGSKTYADPRNPQPGTFARAENSTKSGLSKAGNAIGNGAKKVGSTISNGASKAGAAIRRTGEKMGGKNTPNPNE